MADSKEQLHKMLLLQYKNEEVIKKSPLGNLSLLLQNVQQQKRNGQIQWVPLIQIEYGGNLIGVSFHLEERLSPLFPF